MGTSETNKDLIIMLNDLVIINNDRKEGYKKAEMQVGNNTDLQSIFKDKSQQSTGFRNELKLHIQILGGNFNEETSLAGKLLRTWMSIKNTVKPNNSTSILDSCEFGEDAAQKAYQMALKEDDLPAHVATLISDQKATLRVSHDKIKALRDAQA